MNPSDPYNPYDYEAEAPSGWPGASDEATRYPDPGAGETPHDADDSGAETSSHAASSDPLFGFIVVLALSLGLSPLIPDNTDLRYVVLWGAMAGFGILAWLFGHTTRIEQEQAENLVWGGIFGLIVGGPLLIFGTDVLATTAQLLFRANIDGAVRSLPAGSVLALLVFVQPLAETLFFRGVFQDSRPFWFVGLLATVWSVLVYFPLLDVGQYPLVGVVIGVVLLLVNLIYSYVRRRNGLAAAWACQIVLNLMLLFIPFVIG